MILIIKSRLYRVSIYLGGIKYEYILFSDFNVTALNGKIVYAKISISLSGLS